MSHADRPNVLLIMSDEHAPQFSSVYGHPAVRTPNLERLAARGTTFDNAYCNAPLCVPSRMSFLSGRYVHEIGVWDNAVALDENVVTWAHLCRGAGYDAVLAGKQHFVGSDQLHGFREQLAVDLHGGRPNRIFDWAVGVPPAETPWRALEQAGPGTTPVIEADERAAEAGIRYIREHADAAQPWLLNVSFVAPHFPFIAPQRFWDQYPIDTIDLPTIPDGHLNDIHPVTRRLREYFGVTRVPDQVTRRARRAYYGLISFVDQLVGRVLSALEETGQSERTLVIYTSDHGEMAGEHGLWRKCSFYEHSSRVPLVVSLPGSVPSGRRVPEVVSLVDLAATLVDVTGAAVPSWWPGRSLRDIWRGDAQAWDFAFAEFEAWGVDRPMAMIRQGRYKLNLSLDHPPELFDVLDDPGEFHDLSRDPGHHDALDQLRGRLLAM